MNGKCTDCPNYYVPDKDKKKCIYPDCVDENAVVNKEGQCIKCDKYTKPTSDRRACASDKCTGREFLLESGICRPCPDYEFPDATKDRKECLTKTCDISKKEQLGKDGNCYPCTGALDDDNKCIATAVRKPDSQL